MRKITVIYAALQKREVLEGNFDTMDDVLEELQNRGLPTEEVIFTERYSRSTYSDGEDLPETVKDRNGNDTTDIMFSATTRAKFANGAYSRSEVYILVKKLELQDVIKAKFGKNYTQVSTDKLAKIVNETLKGEASLEEPTNMEEQLLIIKEDLENLKAKVDEILFALFPEDRF